MEESNRATPRCRDVDVNPDWWVDPDVYPEDFPEGKNDRGFYGLDTEFGRVQAQVRIDQLRAQILCYQCPLLEECRSNSWLEPDHVWGGLTSTERWQALRDGQVRPYGTSRASQNGLLRRRIEVAFLAGCSPDDIAATMNLSKRTVMGHLRAILLNARARKEGGSKCQPNPPKNLLRNVQKRTFQRGAESSSNTFHRRSA